MSFSVHPVVRRQTIADALRRTAVRSPGHKTAIACPSATEWTYAEFDALVSRLAAGLARIGVAQGDKVAVLARNSHGFAALRFALARRGAVMVPINFMLKAEEVAYILRHAGRNERWPPTAAWPPRARSGCTGHAGRTSSSGCPPKNPASRWRPGPEHRRTGRLHRCPS
ncbi:MAG: AMP-binding protein [Agrobacterium sp.]|nr:AMP-binding protein [Agrobacterium sp.]